MSISNYVAYLLWGGMILIPINVFVTFFANRHRGPSPWLLGISVCILMLTYVLAGWRFSFVEQVTNAYWLLFCYAIYCFLVASCVFIKVKTLRIAMLLVTAFPICVGYFFATFGILGFFFILGLGGKIDEPQHIEHLSTGFICRTWKWGMVFTGPHFGYSVHLYKTWNVLSLVQQQVASEFIDVGAKEPDVSCSDLLAQYSRQ